MYLEKGAKIDAFQKGTSLNLRSQGSALTFALENKYFNVAYYLIEKGANVNVLGSNNNSSLIYTLQNDCGENILKILFEKGADLFLLMILVNLLKK